MDIINFIVIFVLWKVLKNDIKIFQKSWNKFGNFKKSCYICIVKVIKIAIAIGVLWNIDLWCNGNTAGFGPVIRGSNPRGSTNKQFFEDIHYNIVFYRTVEPFDCISMRMI